MSLVDGIGGVFFRSEAPDALMDWYRETFDFEMEDGFWKQAAGQTVFQPFPKNARYFRSDKQVMINFRVGDMGAVLARLEARGISYWDSPEEDAEYGKFIHLENPEGNPIELWEPRKVGDRR